MQQASKCMQRSMQSGLGAAPRPLPPLDRYGRQDSDLNSGDATTIFASCGSSGNSAIVLPTCRRAEEHGGPLELCGGGLDSHTRGAVDTGARGASKGWELPQGPCQPCHKGETLLLTAPQRSVQKDRPVQESKHGRGYG